MLIQTGLEVKVAIHSLQCPLGVLELRLLVLLWIHLLFALPLAERHTFLVWLLLLFAELLCEFLDLLALPYDVARGVVHWVSCAIVVSTRRLSPCGRQPPPAVAAAAVGAPASGWMLSPTFFFLLFLFLLFLLLPWAAVPALGLPFEKPNG
jgi:hypothetical protein